MADLTREQAAELLSGAALSQERINERLGASARGDEIVLAARMGVDALAEVDRLNTVNNQLRVRVIDAENEAARWKGAFDDVAARTAELEQRYERLRAEADRLSTRVVELEHGSDGTDRLASVATDALHTYVEHEGDWRDGVCACEDDVSVVLKAVKLDQLLVLAAGQGQPTTTGGAP